MKRLLLLLPFFCNLFAQDMQGSFYYPLNTNDFWEYRRNENNGVLITQETRKVIGDTLFPNGRAYRRIEKKSPFGLRQVFQRVDSADNVYQFNTSHSDEFLLFKLNISFGDAWNFPLFGNPSDSGFSQVTQIGEAVFFSKSHKFVKIESFTLPDSIPLGFRTEYILVDSIGVVFEGFEGVDIELQGAIIDSVRMGNITSVKHKPPEAKFEANFLQSYPNPFNSTTTIVYTLAQASEIRVEVFNLNGQRVKLLKQDFENSGIHTLKWKGRNESGFLVASGPYVYSLSLKNKMSVQKILFFLK